MNAGSKPLIIPIFIPHAGCRHRCTYCDQHTVSGTRIPMPTPADIRETIDQYLSFRRPGRQRTEISFFGGNFLGQNPAVIRRLLETAAAHISETGSQIDGIRFSTRPDTIDTEHLDLISAYPVSTVELGVQSMDNRVLERIKRGHTSEETVAALEKLKKAGYRIGCQIMTGLPGEDERSAMATARQVISMTPDFVRIYPALVLAGSPLAVEYRRGRFSPLSLDECVFRLKVLHRLFSENRIPVIRMGLQASTELNAEGTVLAGPYHPSLGHMVLSSLMLDQAQQQLDALIEIPEKTVLRTHPASISRVRGLNNQNIHALKKKYPRIRQIQVRPDPGISADEVVVSKKC